MGRLLRSSMVRHTIGVPTMMLGRSILLKNARWELRTSQKDLRVKAKEKTMCPSHPPSLKSWTDWKRRNDQE